MFYIVFEVRDVCSDFLHHESYCSITKIHKFFRKFYRPSISVGFRMTSMAPWQILWPILTVQKLLASYFSLTGYIAVWTRNLKVLQIVLEFRIWSSTRSTMSYLMFQLVHKSPSSIWTRMIPPCSVYHGRLEDLKFQRLYDVQVPRRITERML